MLKFLFVIAVFAVVTYMVTRLIQEHGDDATPRPRLPRKPQQPSRPSAPDDDEDFLRDLDRRRLNPDDDDPL